MQTHQLLQKLALIQTHIMDMSSKALKQDQHNLYTALDYCAGLLHSTIIDNIDEELRQIYNEAWLNHIQSDDTNSNDET